MRGLLNERRHRVSTSFGSVLDRVLLEQSEICEALSAPHALELCIPGVNTLVFGKVLSLLEALIAARAFVRLLAGVDAAVAVHLRGVFEALLAVGALERLLSRRVAAVLNELRRRQEAPVTQRALQRLLIAMCGLVALQRRRFLVGLAADVALVRLVRVAGRARALAALVPQQLARLAESFAARGTLEQVVHAVHMLMVKQV